MAAPGGHRVSSSRVQEPLIRKIGVSSREEVERFLRSLEEDRNRKASLTRIYESVSGIHSHWISGPDRESLNRALDELKREGILLGVNLDEDEIKEVARKYGRIVEIIIRPEMSVVENHGVEDIRREAEIIINHGCTIEDIEYYLPGFSEP